MGVALLEVDFDSLFVARLLLVILGTHKVLIVSCIYEDEVGSKPSRATYDSRPRTPLFHE